MDQILVAGTWKTWMRDRLMNLQYFLYTVTTQLKVTDNLLIDGNLILFLLGILVVSVPISFQIDFPEANCLTHLYQ